MLLLWLLAKIANNNLQEPLVLVILWVEYFTLLGSHNHVTSLSEYFKQRNLARTKVEFSFRLKDVDCHISILQVLG